MKIRSHLLTMFIGWIGGTALRCISRTMSINMRIEHPGTDPSQPTDRPYLYALWHDDIMVPLAMKGRNPEANVSALVSKHQDGTYLTEFMRHLGVGAVRGSTRHGGVGALRELMRRKSTNIFITPDGPRGPRHELKEGIVFLASQTGMPIIPTASLAMNCWRIQGSWTDLTIPKPFTKAYCLLGAPIHVPPDASRNALEQWRKYVQAEMDRLEEAALCLKRGEEPLFAVRRRAA